MLIKALCDYYDELKAQGKTFPEGYEEIKVDYLICLDDNGGVVDIIPYEQKTYMPKRERTTKTSSYIIDERSKYIFGLFYNQGKFYSIKNEDIVDNELIKGINNAIESHEDFININLKFIEGINSNVAMAYKKFIINWNPRKEEANKFLTKIGKDYDKARFVFCLNKEPDMLLNNDKKVKEKWEEQNNQKNPKNVSKEIKTPCAIYGSNYKIARIHNVIKGIAGGNSSGTKLVSFKHNSGWSYENEEGFNSNISEYAMNKYTEALNYLTKNNCKRIDDVSVVYFAIGNRQTDECDIMDFIFGKKDSLTNEEMENVLFDTYEKIAKGIITTDKFKFDDFKGDFYIVGIKPNDSRLSIKFIYKNSLGKVAENVLRHQLDFKIREESKPVYLWQIRNELVSQKSKTEVLSPFLITKLFESIINGYKYPTEILDCVIRRIKTDRDTEKNKNIKINDIRLGIIKAYINRKCRIENKKEEITMSINYESNNQAYLCGRLFAVLERTQEASLNGKELNKTIKDSYFSSAMTRPALVFPKLIKLSQYHINNIDKDSSKVYFNKLIGEVIEKLNNEFPKNLFLEDQGRFAIGYYQQRQEFFKKKENNKENEEE